MFFMEMTDFKIMRRSREKWKEDCGESTEQEKKAGMTQMGEKSPIAVSEAEAFYMADEYEELNTDNKKGDMENMKKFITEEKRQVKEKIRGVVGHSEKGLDGILVSIGLCIIALLLCVVMKDSISGFIVSLVDAMTTQAQQILNGGLPAATT